MANHGGAVPTTLSRWASVAWRVLVVAAAVVALGYVVSKLELILLPILVAVLITTVLAPPAAWLRRRGWPALLATWVVFFVALGIVAGLVVALEPSVQHEVTSLGHDVNNGVHKVEHWLETGPLHLSHRQITGYVSSARKQVSSNGGTILHGAFSGLTVAAEVLAATLLTAFLTFFFVKDGQTMTGWFVGLLDERRAEDARALGRSVWATLTGYVRGTAANGLVNAVVMSIGLLILGVPLVLVIALLTFVGGFLPIVGALVSGGLAALVALVAKGPIDAAIVLGLTFLIHNLEGYVVGPLVLSRAVKLHPVAVLLALTVGGVLAGVVGAFAAVPVTAALLSVNEFYRRRRRAAPAEATAEGPVLLPSGDVLWKEVVPPPSGEHPG